MEPGVIIKFAASFLFVMGLMGLMAWALKKAGFAQSIKMSSGRRRLSVIESLPIDHRRRLLLVRRDDKEHLIMLGAASETVIETGIVPVDNNVV